MFFESGPSSSSSSSRRWVYDVFLSFRGEDTRKNFTDHLYEALKRSGIRTFRDDDELPKGEEISQQLDKAIQESRISIVVFSKGYASSRWCLSELVKIMECKDSIGLIVIPVFYDIDPSDVRKQTGSVAEYFEAHEERFKNEKEKVNRWKNVLEGAANLSGFSLNDMANGHESKFIDKIIEDVWSKLDLKNLNIPTHLVGIDYLVNDISAFLSLPTDDVRLVGIHGMAGIGKTTIAKAVFNKLFHGFEGSCFLFNVNENSEEPHKQVKLQKQLLYDIFGSKIRKIWNVHEGKNLIEELLRQRRVLVVLDDMDQPKQFKELVEERNWFCKGSRIILTTRNEDLLAQLKVDKSYPAKILNSHESLRLFSWHAFKDSRPADGFVELSKAVVDYCERLPLALEVLGAHFSEMSKPEWQGAMDELRKFPNDNIQKKLERTLQSLNVMAQGMFLDIACFFIGRDVEYVATILDSRYRIFNLKITLGRIRILIERSLITINPSNELWMHDLLRDMGREIIRQMSCSYPGNRSRIWSFEDAWDVLNNQMGTEAVEGLALDVQASKHVPLNTECFKELRRLQLLQINGVHLTGSFELLSKMLIWLCWHECPLNSLPSTFQQNNLVVLDMRYNNFKELRAETKFLNKLKVLDLSYSRYLKKTPSFLGLSSLERLILEHCKSLVEVHQSIGHLQSLVFLNLKGCRRLKILPQSMGDLESLETLDITMCSKLEKLPESLGEMKSLSELLADETVINQLPSSIGQLKNLRRLSLGGRNYKQNSQATSWLPPFLSRLSPRSPSSKALLPASFANLISLTELNLSYCGLSEDAVLVDVGGLSALRRLNLSGNKFVNLPSGIGRLRKLESLEVADCTNLLSVSKLPPSLERFIAEGCMSLERVSISSETRPGLLVDRCPNLIEIEGMEDMGNSWAVFLRKCHNLAYNFKKSLVQELCKGEQYDIIFRGGEIPEWFNHHGTGSSVSFQVPTLSDGNKLQALVVWVVCRYFNGYGRPCGHVYIINKSNGILLFRRSILLQFYDDSNQLQSWVKHITLTGLPCTIKGGEELELCVDVINWMRNDHFQVEKYGLHLILKKDSIAEKQDDIVIPPDTDRHQHHDPLAVAQSFSTDIERWKSYLLRELLQSEICFVERNLHDQFHGIHQPVVYPQMRSEWIHEWLNQVRWR